RSRRDRLRHCFPRSRLGSELCGMSLCRIYAMNTNRLPAHVAIVMDGNGRWANARGLSRTEGHPRGQGPLFECIEAAAGMGISVLSVFVFSTENWRRSPEEVRFLMGYNRAVLRSGRAELMEKNVRVLWSG